MFPVCVDPCQMSNQCDVETDWIQRQISLKKLQFWVQYGQDSSQFQLPNSWEGKLAQSNDIF